jgi:MFS family permease
VVGEFLRSSLSRYTAALEYREFRTMWLASLAAQAAAWALIVARGWLVFDMTGSSVVVGIVTFSAMAPLIFMPPIAGVLADRFDRRNVLAATYAVNIGHNLILAVLAATGLINEWQLIVLSVVNGMARATQQSVVQALAANLVPPERLLNALSLTAATQHASRLTGPALAAPLLGFLGAPAAFFMCTALYALGWIELMKVKTRSRGGAVRGQSFVQGFTAGLKYAWSQPIIRMVLVMVFFHCSLTMAFESLLPTFAAQEFSGHSLTLPASAAPTHEHGDSLAPTDGGFNTEATGFATLMMGVGAGALVGSILIGGIQSRLARGRLYLAMGVLSGFGQVLLAFAPNMGMAVVAAAVMGGSQAAFMTMGQALMQSLAADEFRGRLASLNTLSFGGIMAVMNLFNGYLGAYTTAASILLADGLLFVSIMLASVSFSVPRTVYVRGMPAVRAPA